MKKSESSRRRIRTSAKEKALEDDARKADLENRLAIKKAHKDRLKGMFQKRMETINAAWLAYYRTKQEYRDADPRWRQRAGETDEAISLRVLGRHAPAGHDRHGLT
jgi:hypothetical protein